MAVDPGLTKGNVRGAENGRAQAEGGVAQAEDVAGLAFDIDEQPTVSLHGTGASSPGDASPRGDRLTERTDLLITGFPKPETRRLPLGTRLRLLWHRQILRDARH
jgi:hypothetical protein